MANLKGLAAIVSQLRDQRTNLVNQLRHVDAALSVLGKLEGGRFYTEPRRTLSSAGRARIAAAARARWAKIRASKPGAQANPAPKRTMSASARRKIAASQRARWARLRKR
jgi:hypothetical protein